MQRIIYIADIDKDFDMIGESFLELLEAIVEEELGCNVVRSKLETQDEVMSRGKWEEEEMKAAETAEKLRAYTWKAMEIIEDRKDNSEIVEQGKERIETYQAAEDAVKKQIPMTIQSTSCCKNVCPSCGGAVHKVLSTEVYCQYCGQLIDWERSE